MTDKQTQLEAPTTERIASHTPGPWTPDDRQSSDLYRYILASDGSSVCRIRLGYERDFEQGENDARLIAAAPDLLEALTLVMDTYGFDSSTDSAIWKTAAAAIAKATGEHS